MGATARVMKAREARMPRRVMSLQRAMSRPTLRRANCKYLDGICWSIIIMIIYLSKPLDPEIQSFHRMTFCGFLCYYIWRVNEDYH